MKRYYRPDLEKTLSGDVLYVAVEKNGSEQLNQQSCDCNRLMIVIPERRGDIREKLFNSKTDGWMECEHCHETVLVQEFITLKRIPVFNMGRIAVNRVTASA